MIQVPFVDLKREADQLHDELIKAASNIITSGNYISGPKVIQFEKQFASYCGVSHSIAVGNGSDALTLIMRALDIGPGDEVICPANSFIASAWSIAAVGATPVFCDVENDLLISMSTIKPKINSNTKAIMLVHLTGKIGFIEDIEQYCEDNNIYLIEDAAQSVGAFDDKQRKAGSIGIAGAFSLHPLKNLSIYGDGGIITTNSSSLASTCQILRNHGLINRDECAFWGVNSRLDELQAAFAIVKLKYIEIWTEKFNLIASKYSKYLSDKISTPVTCKNHRDVFHNYVVLVAPIIRDEIMNELLELGVETKIHYPIPLHLQKASDYLGYKIGDLPNVERLAKSMISLPIYPELREEEINHVIESFNTVAYKYL